MGKGKKGIRVPRGRAEPVSAAQAVVEVARAAEVGLAAAVGGIQPPPISSIALKQSAQQTLPV